MIWFGLMKHERTLAGGICKIGYSYFSYPLLEEILEAGPLSYLGWRGVWL